MTSSPQTSPPLRASRAACHSARDSFYECMDDAKAGQESLCKDLRQAYEACCLPSWVRHFDKKRGWDRQKAGRVQFVPTDEKESEKN